VRRSCLCQAAVSNAGQKILLSKVVGELHIRAVHSLIFSTFLYFHDSRV
jgi:hypothetical protein